MQNCMQIKQNWVENELTTLTVSTRAGGAENI